MTIRRFLAFAIAVALLVGGYAVASAFGDPVVRRATVSLPRWPDGARPVRVLLWSDVHVDDLTTPDWRLRRLVERANRLRPDLILLAGDFVGDDAGQAREFGPLRDLRAPLGVVAVLGNHDHWTDPGRVRRALERAGVTVLANEATRRGSLAVGGVDDVVNRRADVPRTAAAARAAGGAAVYLSHSPDIAPALPPDAPLLLAGHTHCGQIVLPLYGPPVDVAEPRYRCGLVREGGRLTVVTAGTGTSVMPLRFGAPPDWWLLTLGP